MDKKFKTITRIVETLGGKKAKDREPTSGANRVEQALDDGRE